MGQKVNPHGLRVGIIKDWDSRWFASKKDFGATLIEDYNLRRELKAQLYNFGISRIEIERDGKRVRISIHTAKPGLVIGKGGSEIEKLKAQCEAKLNKPVSINIVEVKAPELDAQLVAESIAQQLEKRISFRRAMKQSLSATLCAAEQRVSRLCVQAVSAARRSRVLSSTTRVLSRFRRSARTSTTALPRLTQPTAKSALRYGFTRARFSM